MMQVPKAQAPLAKLFLLGWGANNPLPILLRIMIMANTEFPDFIELKTTAKTVSSNAELVLKANDKRRYLLIQNNSSAIAYVAFGDTLGPLVSATTGLKIINAQEKEFIRDVNLSKQSVYITSATSSAMLVTEGAYVGDFTPFDPPPAGASSSSSSDSSASSSSSSST